MTLKNKVAFITGASSGIGESIALAFARKGANIILVSRTREKLIHVQKKITQLGAISEIASIDIAKEKLVNHTIKRVYKRFKRIDILINCAGIFLDKKIYNITLNDWNNVIKINLTGTFLCCKYIIPIMIKQKSGSIFNFSSIGGRIGMENKTAYCASKFGVVGFSRALSKELKKYGIKVHIIYPYLVDSKHKIKWDTITNSEYTILKVDDIADLILKIITFPKRVHIEEIAIKPYLF